MTAAAAAGEVTRVEVRTAPRWMAVCNLPTPATGLEAKFSYKLLAALTLLGVDTGRLDSYTAASCARSDARALRGVVEVLADDNIAETATAVRVELGGASERAVLEGCFDLADAMDHTTLQAKLLGKVGALVGGAAGAERLWENVAVLPRSRPVADLWQTFAFSDHVA